MPDLPSVIPILEYAAGVISAAPARAPGACRLGASSPFSVPETIDMPTSKPGDNTIDPGGAGLPFR